MKWKELTNKNDGEHIKLYMDSVNLDYKKQYPYCAAGQYYCFYSVNNSTTDVPILKSASANGIYDYARKKGTVQKLDSYIPKIDDLIVWIKKGTYTGHIERVIKIIDKNTVETVGFNTNSGHSGSQRDGGGNYVRTRYLNKKLGTMNVRGIISFEVID